MCLFINQRDGETKGDKMELQVNDRVRVSDRGEQIEGRILRINRQTYSIGFMIPHSVYGQAEAYILVRRNDPTLERLN